jgi:ectoine hydroxylase-related dioxygenase (phytanoyl-CoA dioxygenase family)
MCDFILQRSATPDEILEAVDRRGLCVLAEYVSEPEPLKTAALALLRSHGADSYRAGRALRLSIQESKTLVPSIANVLAGSAIARLADAFGCPAPFRFFVTHEYKSYREFGLEANGYLHVDHRHCLTALLYLSDADASSGAFSCVPGSHPLGHSWRLENETLNRVARVPDGVSPAAYASRYQVRVGWEHLLDQVVPVEASAGTLILFNNAMLHFGGRVEPGRERLIARVSYLEA